MVAAGILHALQDARTRSAILSRRAAQLVDDSLAGRTRLEWDPGAGPKCPVRFGTVVPCLRDNASDMSDSVQSGANEVAYLEAESVATALTSGRSSPGAHSRRRPRRGAGDQNAI